jgi:hypothetical protein
VLSARSCCVLRFPNLEIPENHHYAQTSHVLDCSGGGGRHIRKLVRSRIQRCWNCGCPACGGGGVTPTFTPGANVTPKNNGFAPGTITFSGLNGGTNYPSGAVVTVFVFQDQASIALASPQIGGNTASLVPARKTARQGVISIRQQCPVRPPTRSLLQTEALSM